MQPTTRRLLVANGVAVVVAASAVLVQAEGPLDWVVAAIARTFGILDVSKWRTGVRIAVIVSAFAVKFAVDWFESSRPLLRLADIRERYLESHLKPVLARYRELLGLRDHGARLNLMLARKRRGEEVFGFHYPVGFELGDPDKGIVLRTNQGVAGAAFVRGKAVHWYFNDAWNAERSLRPALIDGRPWGFSDELQSQTGHVRWILSVPMFRAQKETRDQVVGVVNFDITDDAAAKKMAESPELIKSLVAELSVIGELCAQMW